MSKTFHLGATLDWDSHERTDTAVEYPSDRLTTHGVIVGMTGSGKTGLGVVLLEGKSSAARKSLKFLDWVRTEKVRQFEI